MTVERLPHDEFCKLGLHHPYCGGETILMTERVWTPEEIREIVAYNKAVDPRDPRRLLPGMDPIFEYHNCGRCRDGERACVHGDPRRCSWPRARND